MTDEEVHFDILEVLNKLNITDCKIKITDELNLTIYERFRVFRDEVDIKPSEEVFNEELRKLYVNKLRSKRNLFLDETDKYMTIDYPHASDEARQRWLDYRQALRDLPATTEDPTNPVWPVRPDEVVPVEETPTEETPIEETPTEETPTEETSVEETPTE